MISLSFIAVVWLFGLLADLVQSKIQPAVWSAGSRGTEATDDAIYRMHDVILVWVADLVHLQASKGRIHDQK